MTRQQEQEREAWLKRPLRPFLMDCAVPALSDALVELCRASPEDPLECAAARETRCWYFCVY